MLDTMESKTQDFSDERLLEVGRRILNDESTALTQMAQRLDDSFCQAISLIDQCVGNVLVCGMGKAGLVGQKVMATMGSLGIRSHFLHPAEAVHGDLGRVRSDDCMLMFSQSGETEEITRLLPALKEMGVPIIAVTGAGDSTLARSATVVLDLHSPQEACPMGLAPSTSTTMMLALGNVERKAAFLPSRFRKESPCRVAGKSVEQSRFHYASSGSLPTGKRFFEHSSGFCRNDAARTSNGRDYASQRRRRTDGRFYRLRLGAIVRTGRRSLGRTDFFVHDKATLGGAFGVDGDGRD